MLAQSDTSIKGKWCWPGGYGGWSGQSDSVRRWRAGGAREKKGEVPTGGRPFPMCVVTSSCASRIEALHVFVSAGSLFNNERARCALHVTFNIGEAARRRDDWWYRYAL